MMQYLVTVESPTTGDSQRLRVDSECPHGMQNFIDSIAVQLDIANPVVTEIDGRSVAHFGSCNARLAS